MLNLVTIGKRRFNANNITKVFEKERDGTTYAFVKFEHLEVVLEGMDAIAFLTWWDSLAVDVHKWMSDNG